MNVVVVGGGIGGLTLAVALERRGVDYLVLEQAPAIAPIGAGLLLSPNATRVLRKLDLLGRILDAGRATDRWRILDQHARVLQELRLPASDPGVSIHRAELQQILLAAVPAARVRLAATVTDVAPTADGVTVTCADGGTLEARGAVGADGVHSRVRAAVVDDGPPLYRGYVGWRGVADFVPSGYDGMLSETWGPGGRFGIAPINGARTYWYASANRPAGWTHPAAQRQCDLLEWFGDWHRPVADLIRATPTETILLNEIADRAPRRGWSRGPMTLLGDAAHPMTPNLGQGACSAIEDAWVLARELVRAPSIADAFRRYERLRYARTASIQRRSLLLGRVVQVDHPWALGVRFTLTRHTPRWLNALAMRDIFAYDADAR